jgi:putative oxidoreductase
MDEIIIGRSGGDRLAVMRHRSRLQFLGLSDGELRFLHSLDRENRRLQFMSILDIVCAPSTFAARVFNPLQPLVALGARVYVGWQFLQSGLIKITSWESTLDLFQTEYHTPWLSPHDAAVAGTFGELFFPALVGVGFISRWSALGLFVVNAVAVISYSQVLLAEGSEAALGQHVLWGSLLLFLIFYGPGKLSLDYFLNRSRF